MSTKVLVVEDDERIRTAVRLALENEGWEVVEARSGEEALQVFPEADADIVLIDIMLPGIDGFEVCRTVSNPNRGIACVIVRLVAFIEQHVNSGLF